MLQEKVVIFIEERVVVVYVGDGFRASDPFKHNLEIVPSTTSSLSPLPQKPYDRGTCHDSAHVRQEGKVSCMAKSMQIRPRHA
ncbi:hypothetical protein Lal_00039785 [Lupinus albus]|nr:hypothetical protein Lal_00039785 [Lupinus albus]